MPQRVVGVGASAGGLEALKQFVGRVPLDSGLAFVVLQHLPPSQTGQLASLLASATAVPVIDVANGHRIEPNTILVVPPHTSARLFRGALVLRTARPGVRPRLPIDALFASIAEVLRERAVGVVLSGTAHDGTEGLRAIRTAGGLTFAQAPSTAQFDEMPRSAIAAGVVEIVLPPAQIADELGRIAKLGPRTRVAPEPSATVPGIDRIFEQLREASGIDFSSYKRTTIERRLARRLTKHGLSSLDEYSAYLTANPDEASTVYEDLLIHVTEFFRDRPVFDRLVEHVLPELLRARPAAAPVRVWVPGCSTGEEVYSLAIALIELCGERRPPIQLFGSDLSERAIECARQGHYPDAIAAQVGEVRLARFFRREEGGYRINREVRERCVFVHHDLVTDPPFSKLDLVSCRNVLIYLDPSLQQRVIPILHYALNQPGYLVLGPAETISGFEALFQPVDADARIYARSPGPRTSLTFPMASQLGRLPTRRPSDAVRSALDMQREVDHVLLARYAPAWVVIDENLEVVQFRGRTGSPLEAPPGQQQVNVFTMARKGLSSVLPLALQRAQRSNAPVRQEDVIVHERGHEHRFHLEVVPLRSAASAKRQFLVVFEPAAARSTRARPGARGKRQQRGEPERLREELDATKEYLNSVVTQHLATSEELSITNEELQSTNEELQSTNEELQTAKEELQSTNEELETVNEELLRGNVDLREANDDLVNVLASVDIAIIIVDTERRVRRFTPKARAVMKLIPGDVGRPISDLRPSVELPGLDDMIAGVVETLAVCESEVHHPDGTSYRMQIRPYRTADHRISGAVIAFVDITTLRAARDYTAAIVDTVPSPLVVVDDRLLVRSANPAFCAMLDIAPRELVGRALLDVGDWRPTMLRERLAEVVATGTGFENLDLELRGRTDKLVLRLGARVLPATGDRLILVAIADVTEQRRLEQVRAAAERERDSFLDAVSHELRTPLSAILLWAEALRGLEDGDPRRLRAIETIEHSARAEAQLVDDLLDLALSRTSELAVTLVPVDPSAIVGAAIEAMRPEADAKRISIETTLATGPTIAADPRRLRQIASNLLGNAIKFTPEGGNVTVALAHDRGAMELRIGDTGPGIPPDFRMRAFEAFSQADPSITRAHRGLGIGLALVRHFVVRQGGTIDIASSGAGDGTTFTVRIPAHPG